jgi:LytS/YehU family sensor histidine kinase
MITDLHHYFREFIKITNEHPIIRLNYEIDLAQKFLELQKSYNLIDEYSIDVDPGIDPNNNDIVAGLFLPLIENSIMHGFSKHTNRIIRISIKTKTTTKLIQCSYEDTGSGFRQDQYNSTGYGLSSLPERIKLFCKINKKKTPAEILKIANKTDNGVLITFNLPQTI